MHILINVPCGKDTLKNDIQYWNKKKRNRIY